MLCAAESQKLWRVDVVVNHGWIVPVGHIIKTGPQGQIVMEQAEAALDVRVQCKVSWKTARTRKFN